MESYLAVYEVRPRWRVVFVHSLYFLKYSHCHVEREACRKDRLNSQGDTLIEKVRQIPSKTKINSFICFFFKWLILSVTFAFR